MLWPSYNSALLTIAPIHAKGILMFEPLAGLLRLQRMKRNLTVRQLARKAGVNHLQLALLEDGHCQKGGGRGP